MGLYNIIENYDEYKIENNNSLIETFKDKLINEEKEYIIFKKKIMSDTKLDNQMKSILLQSRKDYLDNLKKKIDSQSNIIYDVNSTSELNDFMREFNKKCLKSKIYQNYKEFITKKIQDYSKKKINVINLEFEMCWDINELINKKIFDPIKKKKIV